jgi:uncharacterized protein (DUF983 family)
LSALFLAHGGAEAGSGPNAEFVIFGVGLVVMSLIFFFQKNVKPQVSLVLLAMAAALFAGAFAFH